MKRLRDGDQCSKFVLLFVILILSCYFCAMILQANQDCGGNRDLCCVQKTFKWDFIPLHHGSVCESMVRKMNNAMKVIAGESMLKDKGLQTMLEEGHSALLMTLERS